MIASRPPVPADRQLVQAYEPGGFRVSGVRHRGSLLVFPEAALAWAAATLDEVDLMSLEAVVAHEPRVEILLLGGGAGFRPVPPALRQALRERGIVVEPMTTPAACRTYNILLAEERRVAAALIAMPPPA